MLLLVLLPVCIKIHLPNVNTFYTYRKNESSLMATHLLVYNHTCELTHETNKYNILSSRLCTYKHVSRVHAIYVCSYKYSMKGEKYQQLFLIKIHLLRWKLRNINNSSTTTSCQTFWIYVFVVMMRKGVNLQNVQTYS